MQYQERETIQDGFDEAQKEESDSDEKLLFEKMYKQCPDFEILLGTQM